MDENQNTVGFLKKFWAVVVTNFKKAKIQVTTMCFLRLQNNFIRCLWL